MFQYLKDEDGTIKAILLNNICEIAASGDDFLIIKSNNVSWEELPQRLMVNMDALSGKEEDIQEGDQE